jgi:hypothetical protein
LEVTEDVGVAGVEVAGDVVEVVATFGDRERDDADDPP